MENPFDSVEDALVDIANGRMVIVTDDASRENEGDLVMAASKATPETINCMIRHARGLICVPTTGHQLRRLGIHPMASENRESHGTDFAVSVDAAQGITTGISAYDRAQTIRLLGDPKAQPDDLVQPGHVFPLRAKQGGVLERAGHTEAAVDLAQLAGLHPSGVICEILNEDGTLARLPDLIRFKQEHGLKLISIASLIEYRHKRDPLIRAIGTQNVDTAYGSFTLHLFRSVIDERQHYALSMGELGPEPTLVRVHGENILTDTFRAEKAGTTLDSALRAIAHRGRGVLLYITRPNGGIVVPAATKHNETKADSSAEQSMDFRAYGIGAQILVALGLRDIELLSTTPRKVVGLDGYGLNITAFTPGED
jgi:3,4-dihydroxy 2-butanone 4-phosphate synthase/GTP cyclohydrolase II